MKSIKILLIIAAAFMPMSAHAFAEPLDGVRTVYMEEMTWQEVKARISGGARIAIVPTGSTEQGGPQLITGYHNEIVRYTAGEIAGKLGNALVAPVIPFAPAGRVSPPEGHMLFPGTVSITAATYSALLEDTARALKQHGFSLICFIGDAAGSQLEQARLATRLTEEWRSQGVRVLNVSNYYYKNGHEEFSETLPVKVGDAEAHGGHAETSQLMAIDAEGVRDSMRAVRTERDYRATGAMGDSSVASAAYGRKYLSLKIEAAIKQIQHASSHAR